MNPIKILLIESNNTRADIIKALLSASNQVFIIEWVITLGEALVETTEILKDV